MSSTASDSSEPSFSAREVFRAWERLRLVYIAALAVVFLITASNAFGFLWLHPFFMIQWIVFAFAANLCYFAGPATEAYCSWLGLRGRYVRLPLFAAGTLFAALLTVLSVLAIAANPPYPVPT